ncbi:AraC family transcriptional regulator [Paenibacillus sp. CGMCC 1.16610]|uniref:AraC family transcriptional regulator n=1 Tax=Paenibacillus anseongense TaxID=2682845 RepID=A0ABW9U4Z4_9BACL|nr:MULTISPECIES: AraC family transcriptional regulator [Paenibacillus]MBA2940917.1 AraC family transcriptional regulator [Paenibacillus sp. CGMCC 1.16610]MVQ34101.1 AraC family transcriptional regulator [Paenibacillus anseongense]
MSAIFLKRPVLEGAIAFHRKARESCHFPLHRHEAMMEILFIAEGEADYWIDGKHYEARAGDMVIFRPLVWHEERSRIEAPFSFYYAGFHSLQVEGLSANHLLEDDEQPVFSVSSNAERIKHLFQELCDEVNEGWSEALTSSGLLLELLLLEVHRTKHHAPGKTARLSSQTAITKARRYIEERYHEPLTIKQIADHVYLSPSHLSHLFRDAYGESPIQFAIHQRIHAARRYLTTTEFSVEQIARLVGYESVTAFQNLFKKATGLAPGTFRKETLRPSESQ